MGIYGGGNLDADRSAGAGSFTEQLHLSSALQIALLAVVPLITQPLFLPCVGALSSMAGTLVVSARARAGRWYWRALRCAVGVIAVWLDAAVGRLRCCRR